MLVGTSVKDDGGNSELVNLPTTALDRHAYVLGASGSGKSCLLELLIRQHIIQGDGFALIDPHGDLTQNVLRFLASEAGRASELLADSIIERTRVIEPFRSDAVIGMNALHSHGGPLHPHVGELVSILRRFWANSWGPRMEELLRTALLTLALAGDLTLVEVAPLLTDAEFRMRILTRVSDPAILAYWSSRYNDLTDAARMSMAEPVLNKMGGLLADPRVRAMLGQSSRGLDLRQAMDEGGWLLVNCAKGLLRDAAYLIGSLIVASLQSAAMSRADQAEELRRPFTVFVDEFQNFRGDDFETILCEARKYRLRLVLAHQHLGQLDPTLQSAIFGNVATQYFFGLSAHDAGVVSRHLKSSVGTSDSLTDLGVGRAVLHRRGVPSQTVEILPVLQDKVGSDHIEDFQSALRRRHSRPIAEIEAQMAARLLAPSTEPSPRQRAKAAKATPPRKRRAPATNAAQAAVQEADDA